MSIIWCGLHLTNVFASFQKLKLKIKYYFFEVHNNQYNVKYASFFESNIIEPLTITHLKSRFPASIGSNTRNRSSVVQYGFCYKQGMTSNFINNDFMSIILGQSLTVKKPLYIWWGSATYSTINPCRITLRYFQLSYSCF